MRGSAAFRTGVAPGGALAPGWVKNELWRNARAVPSLDLRFADDKSLVDATTGASLVTFTRASSGTFVGSDGVLRTAATNEPRFDHNPTTGESLGLLVEEARTNLLVRSEEFETTWAVTRCLAFGSGSIANAIEAPDGTLTADKLVEDTTASNTHFILQTLTVTSGTTYTGTVYVKAAERFNVAVITGGTPFGGNGININLQTGATSNFSSPTAIYSTPLKNGWYRVGWTLTASATGTGQIQIRIKDDVDNQSYTGDGTSGIYIWGAQLEAGAFPSSYILNVNTPLGVTRSADVASIGSSAFTSFYNQSEGTLFCEYNRPSAVTSLRSVVATSDGGFATRATFRTDSSTVLTIFTVNGGVGQATFPLTAVSGANNKGALAYKVNAFNAAANGLIGIGDTSASVGVANQLSIGSVLGAEPSCSYIRRITFWPQRLPDNTLQSITR